MTKETKEQKGANDRTSTAGRQIRAIEILIPALAGVASLLALFCFSWVFAKSELNESFALSASIILAAMASGWVFGIVISPLDKREETTFAQYAKAVTVFASGFLLAKLSEAITAIFSPAYSLTLIGGFRIIAFTGFLVAMMLMFGWRRYAIPDAPVSNESDAKPAPVDRLAS